MRIKIEKAIEIISNVNMNLMLTCENKEERKLQLEKYKKALNMLQKQKVKVSFEGTLIDQEKFLDIIYSTLLSNDKLEEINTLDKQFKI